MLSITGNAYAEWSVGTTFSWLYNCYSDFGYSDSAYVGYLRIADLREVAKEPGLSSLTPQISEPAIILLVGIGLVGLTGSGRKRPIKLV